MCVSLESRGGITLVSVDRPPANAISVELLDELVAGLEGLAAEAGLVLALCADLRIASLQERYGLTEIKVGVPYPQAAIGVVRAELSTPAARKLVLSNQLIDGPEALRLRLFDEAVDPGAVLPRALELATEMAAFPADVYAPTKAELRSRSLNAIKTAVESEPLLERWL